MRIGVLAGAVVSLLLLSLAAAAEVPEDAELHVTQATATSETHTVTVPGLIRAEGSPEVELSIDEVYQGGALQVRVTSAQSGSVRALGREYTLSKVAEGGLAGFVGVGTGDEAGRATMRIDVVDQRGRTRSFTRTFTVVATRWPVEEIWFPTSTPGPTPTPDPDPPPPLPDDNEILPGVYAAMSERQWGGEWVLPIDEPNLRSCESGQSGETACVSSYFGTQRSYNGGAVGGHHGGTDLAAWAGTTVRATNAGEVVLAGEYRVRGNLVVVDHGGGIFSSYGHLSSIAVQEGERVGAGDIVGEVGSTGLSTGPHLHWEMVVDGVLVDGLRWLDGTQGF